MSLWFKGGHTACVDAARWNAQCTMEYLLADPHGARSPQSGQPLIAPV